MKTDKIRPDQFCQFTKNRSGEFEFFQKFEIKNPKKTSRHFKNFGQNRIKKFIVFRSGKFEQICSVVKSEKIDLTCSI
jgi:hypothetical protein